MTTTLYDKKIIDLMEQKFPGRDAGKITENLIRMGLVDSTKCKILMIREFVSKLVRNGSGKIDAMYTAAEEFCCSFEYVRKCIYYYKNINLDC